MRLFIAIDLPRSFKKEVQECQRALQAVCTGGRFVPGDNFHITLHFIGESNDLADAAAAMGEAVRGIRPFNLRLCGYDSFKKGDASTALLRLDGDLDELNALYESLQAALYDHGFSRDMKRFVPHITLGRAVQFAPGAEESLKALSTTANVRVQAITLFVSEKEDGRMVYNPLHRESF